MPDLNLKVTPVFGESKYSYTLIHDFLEARIRDELKVSSVSPHSNTTSTFGLLLAHGRSPLHGRSTAATLPRLGDRRHVRRQPFLLPHTHVLRSFSGEIASKPANPLVDSLKGQTAFRDRLQEYKDIKELNRAGSSSPPEQPKSAKQPNTATTTTEELGEEMTEL